MLCYAYQTFDGNTKCFTKIRVRALPKRSFGVQNIDKKSTIGRHLNATKFLKELFYQSNREHYTIVSKRSIQKLVVK